jgi:peptidyl-prolyl cis-trans isomerase D
MFMQKLRKYAKIYLWIVVGGFVGWIFFDLGADLVGKRVRKPWERGLIAEIDGRPVPYEWFKTRLDMAIRDSSEAKGGRELTDQEVAAIEEAVWKQMIEDIKWFEYIRERHLNLADETIIQLIKLSPPPEVMESEEFKTEEGEFDVQKYLRALYDPRNLPFFKQYEARLREEIPKMLMQIDIFSSIPVTDSLAWKKFLEREEEVKVEFLGLVPRTMPDSVNYTKEDVERYYFENREKFKQPERANIAFVMLKKIPSKEDTLEAKDKLETAYEEIKSGIKFEEIVDYYSEDENTKKNSGDLGWFTKDRNPKEIYEVAMKLKEGEVSKPFLSPLGWHLIKVDEKKKDKVKVKHILVRIKTGFETKEKLREKAQKLQELATEIGLERAADSLGFEVRKTDIFKLNSGFVPYIGPDKEILEFIRKNERGTISPVFRRPSYYLVFEILEKLPSEYPPLKEIEKWVESELKRELKRALADSLMGVIHGELVSGKTMEEVAKEYERFGIIHRVPPYFTRDRAIPDVGYKTAFHGVAFSLKKGELSKPFETSRGFYILKVLDRKEPSREAFEKEKKNIKALMRNRFYSLLFNGFTSELRKNAKIKDYRNYILY